MQTLKRAGRPKGGKNLVFVSIQNLREKLQDSSLIPVSITFAKTLGLEGEIQDKKEFKKSKPIKVTVQNDF